MSRVSDNSNTSSINFSVNQTKTRLEDLQLKGANLKKMVRPSDDPVGNIELMQIRSVGIENDQLKRNASFATTSLEYTENSLKELTEILNKVKEVAIAQSSDLYNGAIRSNIAKEISQLRKQVLGIANRRLGNRYIFSGFKTMDKPFNEDGKYLGDRGTIYLEVLKNFYVPSNIPGNEVFFSDNNYKLDTSGPNIEHGPVWTGPMEYSGPDSPSNSIGNESEGNGQVKGPETPQSKSMFDLLRTLEDSLITNNSDAIQNLLEDVDEFMGHVLSLQTGIGSTMNTLSSSENTLSEMELFNASRKSKIEDADIAELYSDLQKQGHLLQATYKTGSKLLNNNLLDFLK